MKLPQEIKNILQKLSEAGHEGYAVGGCVRDLLLGKKPEDWDVTTDAAPEEIQKIFPENFYENNFGTVTVKTPPLMTRAGQAGSEDPTLAEIQITPFRIETIYKDKRHPEEVQFVKKLDEDLSRRDFTINAMAIGLRPQFSISPDLLSQIEDSRLLRNRDNFPRPRLGSAEGGQFPNKITEINSDLILIDLFEGQSDLKKKLIRTVGEPTKRFGEDALRLLRAARIATTLGFEIEKDTLAELKANAEWLRAISKERIRDEFVKIIESDRADEGVLLLEETNLLQYIAPELREGIGIDQNLHHIYSVWEHSLRALKYATNKKYSLAVRLASLFHDIGKPRSKRGETHENSTFYGHEVIGSRMVAGIMEHLRFPKELCEKVIKLVRYHMFFYMPDTVTESSVRRLLANVGKENIEDLLKVREADRIGSGRPKAIPYKLRHLKYIVDKVSHDPISVKMLKVNGEDVMQKLDIKPGPKVGLMLNSLLAEVIDDPIKNEKEYLMKRIHELDKKSPEELKKALDTIEEAVDKEEKERMKKYYV